MANLDVLLIESRAGFARQAQAELEEAGHRVHRCHEPGEPAFPCKALREPGGCPLDGHIDVALLVRPRIAPRPTAVEDGLSCAVRARVPIVEQGSDVLDPFAPWVTRRVHAGGDVVEACHEAIDIADGPLRREIVHRTAHLVEGAGLPVNDLTVDIVHDGADLEIRLERSGTPDPALDHRLAVRALDAVRGERRTAGGETGVYVQHR